MWQEILRERAERRHARYLAKRAAAAAKVDPSGAAAPARKRGRPRLTAPSDDPGAPEAPAHRRRADPK
jgi:hypothetical protein